MSTSKNSLGFARVAATIAAAMITAAIIAVAILVLTAASADSAENVSHSEDVRTSGVADARPAPGFVNTIDPIASKPASALVNTSP
jgi:hypothetical protein